MSRPIPFHSWFAIPRDTLRKNADEPLTAFERVSSPETRLLLHLLKLRKPYHGGVEIKNVDLAKLVGLDARALRRARDKLVAQGLIRHQATDGRKETHQYAFIEAGAALVAFDGPDEYAELNMAAPVAEPISAAAMTAALNPAPSLEGSKGRP